MDTLLFVSLIGLILLVYSFSGSSSTSNELVAPAAAIGTETDAHVVLPKKIYHINSDPIPNGPVPVNYKF